MASAWLVVIKLKGYCTRTLGYLVITLENVLNKPAAGVARYFRVSGLGDILYFITFSDGHIALYLTQVSPGPVKLNI